MVNPFARFLKAARHFITFIQIIGFYHASNGANEHLAALIHTAAVRETAVADLKYWTSVGYRAVLVHATCFFLLNCLSIFLEWQHKTSEPTIMASKLSNKMFLLMASARVEYGTLRHNNDHFDRPDNLELNYPTKIEKINDQFITLKY